MRHRGQINEVEVELSGDGITSTDLQALERAFVDRYELLYGRGASLPGATLEIVTFRSRASAALPKPVLGEQDLVGETPPAAARRPSRSIYWAELGESAESGIYDGAALLPGNRVEGPAVVETEATSVVVHPGQVCAVDRFGNFELRV